MSNKQPQVYFYVPYADVLQVREDEEKYTYANGIVSRRKFLKSPLNYIGGKYKLLPQLIEFFPEKINTFVDLFSGGFNVGINVDCNKVICNDMNTFIIDLYKELYSKPIDETLNKITGRINEYGLSKENEEAFKKFRDYYNKTKEPIDLYTLSCYSFNYQFRFNNNKEYNNPFGRNRSQFSDNMKSNLILFTEKLKSMNVEFLSEPFDKVDLSKLNNEDFVYCDPPYLITTGSYNDGNRGFKDWKEEEEIQLYKVLDELNKRKVKFALSNVIEHKGKENILLKEWSKKYKTIYLTSDYSNSSYNTKRDKSIEVLIINYKEDKMIELRKMENRKFRTFGWVQDPSDFKSLYNVVAIFDNTSEVHKQLVDERIEKLIEEKDGRSHFLEVMRSKPLKIKYTDLIGTAFTPRSSARCNGIVQATVEGQKRKFISDWPADNFVRWAHCLGFIQYNYEDDTFEITKKGLEWIKTKDASEGKLLLEEAILSYPPAIRILRLLSNGKVMTKFELGSNLGFIGEDGFTSIPQNVLIMTLATTESINEKNKIKTNTEGSSDKYARMIGKWLTELGLLKQVTKEIVVAIGGKDTKRK